MTADTTPAQVRPGLFHMSSWWTALLDLIYPPSCENCGQADTRWCADCNRALEALPLQPIPLTLPPYAAVLASSPHSGLIRHAIHGLKYGDARALARPLGARLAALVRAQGWQPDAVTCVPIHSNRRRKRGYNQCELLGEVLAEQLNLPFLPNALERLRDTPAQVGLNAAERMTNVADAFRSTAEFPRCTFLLLDDVCTTGSTLAACAAALMQAEAAPPYGVTLAAAVHS